MEIFQVNVSVTRSCILSPKLYNITIDFVMIEVHTLDTHFQLGNMMTTDTRYADDSMLILPQFRQLERVTDEVSQACR